MHFFHRGAVHHFGAALGVADIHAEQNLNDRVKTTTGESPLAGLHLVQHRAGHPAGTDHAIRLVRMPHQIKKRSGLRRSIGIDISDQVRQRGHLESFDQRASFADGFGVIDAADLGKFGGNRLDDPHGVVAAAVENDDQLEFALIIPAEEFRITAQHRPNPVLFIVSRNQ